MEITRFDEIAEEFIARVSKAVYCSMATVDRLNRPRSRFMHPIWEVSGADGPTGWVISWPGSHKARHLARNPAVSLAYLPAVETPVYVDGSTEWVQDPAEQRRVWELHQATPPPLGFDPLPHYGSIEHPYFGLLKIIPWRIELASLGGEPRTWRRS